MTRAGRPEEACGSSIMMIGMSYLQCPLVRWRGEGDVMASLQRIRLAERRSDATTTQGQWTSLICRPCTPTSSGTRPCASIPLQETPRGVRRARRPRMVEVLDWRTRGHYALWLIMHCHPSFANEPRRHAKTLVRLVELYGNQGSGTNGHADTNSGTRSSRIFSASYSTRFWPAVSVRACLCLRSHRPLS
jgi:hypothetical protein